MFLHSERKGRVSRGPVSLDSSLSRSIVLCLCAKGRGGRSRRLFNGHSPKRLAFGFSSDLQSKPLFSLSLFAVYSAPPLSSAGVLLGLSGTPACVCRGR